MKEGPGDKREMCAGDREFSTSWNRVWWQEKYKTWLSVATDVREIVKNLLLIKLFIF